MLFMLLMAVSLTACAGRAPQPDQAQIAPRSTVTPTEGQSLTQIEGERVVYFLPAHAGKVVRSRYQEDGRMKEWQSSRIGPDGFFDQHVTNWSAPIYYSVLDQNGNPVLSWTTNIVQPGQGVSSWSPGGMQQPSFAAVPAVVPVVQESLPPPPADARIAEARALYEQAQSQVESLELSLRRAKGRQKQAQGQINKASGKGCDKCAATKDAKSKGLKARAATKPEIASLERQLREAKVNRDVAARVYQAMLGGQSPTLAGVVSPAAARPYESRLAATGIPQQLTPSADRCGSQAVMDLDISVPASGQRITQKFGTAVNYRNFPKMGVFRIVQAEWLNDSNQWRPMDRGFPLNIGPNDSGHMRQFFCDWQGDGAKNKTIRYNVTSQGQNLGSWEVKLQ